MASTAFLIAASILLQEPAALECQVVLAPAGSTSEGSGYTAIVAGPDGRVWVGSARYGGYGWLLELDPRTRILRKAADLREVTGEDLRGIHTQAKIHSKMSISSDGKLYFASKQGHEVFDSRPEFEDGAGYPGGHLCVLDTSTGLVRDLGIPLRGEGLLWAVLDESRRRVYLKGEPRNHFLYHDLATGRTHDRGNLGGACRYMALDARGTVWTIGRGGNLCRFDPETDLVEDLEPQVEGEGPAQGEERYRSPYVIVLAPDGRRLYGLVGGHPHLMEYDLDRARDGRVPVRNAAPALPGGKPVRDVHAAVFGKDGRLYWPVLTDGDELHLVRFDPASGQAVDLGVPRPTGVDDDRDRGLYARSGSYRLEWIQGAAVGPEGTLYLLDIYPQLNVAIFPRLTAR